ncbi:MAG: iron ABC transporter [Bacteroidetes bacterium GWF2_33_16]|nr:MAG: iron ABC transporter [Bacteroidetes bacterium GWE2_32_14]OFY06681.1 MAG: iron ABC transporter [Bacteroidetes bacterium GWF2_33_16]
MLFLADVFLGSVNIPIKEILRIIFSGNSEYKEFSTIVLQFRLPKALTALLAGFALSVSGLQMQTIFKNPLAGPYVLGISSGASLGVAILVLGVSSAGIFGQIGPFSNWIIVLAAWIGSGLILLLILAVSTRVKDIMTILILGIMFGSATTAVVGILQYFSNETMLKAFIIWTMGSLGGVSMSQLYVLTPSVLLGLVIALISVKMLNALLLGENYAKSMGLNIRLSRFFIFISTSLLAGTITAFCGPIGFIGIAVPHLARLVFKTANHSILLPGSMIIGGIVLLLSDIISQLPGKESSLPINSITALVGIPIVIWIIIRKQRFSNIS